MTKSRNLNSIIIKMCIYGKREEGNEWSCHCTECTEVEVARQYELQFMSLKELKWLAKKRGIPAYESLNKFKRDFEYVHEPLKWSKTRKDTWIDALLCVDVGVWYDVKENMRDYWSSENDSD